MTLRFVQNPPTIVIANGLEIETTTQQHTYIIDEARECSGDGRGCVTSSPLKISPTILSGRSNRSSYVAYSVHWLSHAVTTFHGKRHFSLQHISAELSRPPAKTHDSYGILYAQILNLHTVDCFWISVNRPELYP